MRSGNSSWHATSLKMRVAGENFAAAVALLQEDLLICEELESPEALRLGSYSGRPECLDSPRLRGLCEPGPEGLSGRHVLPLRPRVVVCPASLGRCARDPHPVSSAAQSA
jgi:hypothetical protein